KFISAPDGDQGYGQLPWRFSPRMDPDKQVATHPGSRKLQDANSSSFLVFQMIPFPPPSHQQTWNAWTNHQDLAWFADQFLMRGSLYPRTPVAPKTFPICVQRNVNAPRTSFFFPAEPDYANHIVQVGPLDWTDATGGVHPAKDLGGPNDFER